MDHFPWFFIPVLISIIIIALSRKTIDELEAAIHITVGAILGAMWFQGGFEVFLFGFVFANLGYLIFFVTSGADETSLPTFLSATGAVSALGWLAGEWVGLVSIVMVILVIAAVRFIIRSIESKSN